MVRKLYFVMAIILGLAFNSCTNDVNDGIIAGNESALSNTDAETVKLKSGFTVTKENGVYSMGDILLSDEQVKLLDETGSIYPTPSTVSPSDSLMVSPITGTKVLMNIRNHPNQ